MAGTLRLGIFTSKPSSVWVGRTIQQNLSADGEISLGEELREEAFAYRIELWFKPDSGAPDRLLMSRTYKLGAERPH